MMLLSFERPAAHRDLHSFPTRRSSDLDQRLELEQLRAELVEPRRQGAVQLVQRPPRLRGRIGVDQVGGRLGLQDRKSTRLNSSHTVISYAVFCLKKKKEKRAIPPARSR